MSWLRRLMPYDLYERHAVVGRLLREAIAPELGAVRILDVGGRAGLLDRFTPHEVISLNVDGSADVLYDGRTIPFAEETFQAVISIDTLEHLPKHQRLAFLRECLRVSRATLLVAAPYGSEAHVACEKRLGHLYRALHGRSHTFLEEHVRYGLPTAEELERLVGDLGGTDVQLNLAGDYRREARQFERAIKAESQPGRWGRLQRAINRVLSMALFHPLRLRSEPYPAANRFYLLLAKP